MTEQVHKNRSAAAPTMSTLPTPLLLAMAVAGLFAPASAQEFNAPIPVPTAQAAPAPAPTDNGMELVRDGVAPKFKSTARRAPAKANQLYRPIQKEDDAGQVPEIELFLGESRVFPTPGVARIAVGSGGVITAAVLDDKETIIFGNGVGTTSLFVWHADGRYQRLKVNVIQGDTSRIAREVAAFLTTIPNAKASVVGDKVIVEGDELTDGDRAKVAELAKRYPQIVNFTSPVGLEKMVMMDVKVVEFPKSELRELGLRWSPSGGGAIGGVWAPFSRVTGNDRQITLLDQGLPAPIGPVGGGGGSYTLPSSINLMSVLNLGLNAQLTALQQSGKASILAEPQLSARSGSKASFMAGGEIPYAITSIAGSTVQFKQYGIKLDIEPQVGPNGVIRAVIMSEVSDLDRSFGNAGTPGLLTRRTNTEFNVRDGETIVLSGLLQRNKSEDVDKVPFLGDLPVIGALFRSKRYQNKETELVVFVTPTVVTSRTPGMVDRIERTNARLTERMAEQPFLTDPLQPGRDAGKPAAPLHPSDLPSTAPAAAVPAPSRPSGTGSALRVKLDGLVIRAVPDTRSNALFELGHNSVVWNGPIEDRVINGVRWRHVVTGDVKGWVTADGVEAADGRIVPAAAGPVARKDQLGKPLTLGQGKPGVVGLPAQGVTAEPAAGTAGRYSVNLDGLALYVGPDTNALVVQKLALGTVLTALPQPARGNWIAVQAGEQVGWVASQWLRPISGKE